MIKLENNKIVILFDGICNLCVYSVQFIINRDSEDIFRFASIQSKIGQKFIEKYSIDITKNDSIILINDAKVNYRSTAFLSIVTQFKGFWKITFIFYLIPTFIRDILYNFIAKRRYSLFGKKNQCIVPNSNIKKKFYE